MAIDFISMLQSFQMEGDIHLLSDNSSLLYVYDLSKYTYMTTIKSGEGCLTVHNDNETEVTHVCVDGGMITYGCEDYVGDGKTHGRCDCMVFSDSRLFLVELKCNLTTIKDKKRWKAASEAMGQIGDYYDYLQSQIKEKGQSLSDFFSTNHIKAVVCMSPKPLLRPVNTQRLTNIERFRASHDGVNLVFTTEISL